MKLQLNWNYFNDMQNKNPIRSSLYKNIKTKQKKTMINKCNFNRKSIRNWAQRVWHSAFSRFQLYFFVFSRAIVVKPPNNLFKTKNGIFCVILRHIYSFVLTSTTFNGMLPEHLKRGNILMVMVFCHSLIRMTLRMVVYVHDYFVL